MSNTSKSYMGFSFPSLLPSRVFQASKCVFADQHGSAIVFVAKFNITNLEVTIFSIFVPE